MFTKNTNTYLANAKELLQLYRMSVKHYDIIRRHSAFSNSKACAIAYQNMYKNAVQVEVNLMYLVLSSNEYMHILKILDVNSSNRARACSAKKTALCGLYLDISTRLATWKNENYTETELMAKVKVYIFENLQRAPIIDNMLFDVNM